MDQPRAVRWQRHNDEVKLALALDDLDEHEARLTTLEQSVKKRLDWIVGLVVSLLLTVCGALAVILATTGR